MRRSSFISTESRCGQPAAEFFEWPLAIRQEIIRRVCVPGIRAMLEATFKETDGLLVAFTAERLYVAQRSLQASQRALEAGDEHRTSFGTYRPPDLPSVRAGLAIVNPIVAALSGADTSEQKAA